MKCYGVVEVEAREEDERNKEFNRPVAPLLYSLDEVKDW